MNSELYDVFVSGAGPVGLLFAFKMLKMGHTVYMCDYKFGPTDQTRAFGITSRTMEVLAMDGIAHHFLKRATVIQGTRVLSNGTIIGGVHMPAGGLTPFPHATLVPQDTIEEILIQLVESACHGTIRWGTRLVEYEQQNDHVQATVHHQDGSLHTVRAKYMVGADGTHSTVRKTYRGHDAWRYDGQAIATRFALADVTMQGPDVDKISGNHVICFSHPDGVCNLFPLDASDRNRFRIGFNLGPYETSDSDATTHGIAPKDEQEPLTLDQVRSVVAERAAPLELTPTDPTWLTVFRINERKANGFRRGRLFVVGDAAHCHSPVGGQGLNLGMQDVNNLAWKLSLVLKGQAQEPEKLLDSYTIEREPAVQDVLSTTSSLTRVGISKLGFISRWIGTCTFYAVSYIERLNSYVYSRMMQVHTHIGTDSPIHLPSTLCESGRFVPDTAAMQRRIIDSQLVRRSLHDILSHGPSSKHVLLWIGTRHSTLDRCPWTHDFWSKARAWRHWARLLVVESNWHTHGFVTPRYAATDDDLDNVFWLEPDWQAPDSLSQRIGLAAHMNEPDPPAALVVIRPDYYIAYSSLIRSPRDIDTSLQLLNTYLVNP